MSNNESSSTMSEVGFLGMVIAGFVSYVLNGFWWSVFHCLFGWTYLIYATIRYHDQFKSAFTAFFS